MQRLFSLFPDCAPGIGLLLLRVALAGALWPLAHAHAGTVPVVLALLLGALLCAGLLTPLASTLYAVWQAWAVWSGTPETALALLALSNAGVLLLLGPGAYAADARLFGRRVLHVRRARKRE